MSSVYIASSYSRREEMRSIAERLAAAGHTITSRWIDGDPDLPPDIEPLSDRHLAWAAHRCTVDVLSAEVVLNVTGPGTVTGGRHVELGLAYMGGQRLILLGPRENVFHHWPNVEQYDDLDAVIEALECHDGEEIKDATTGVS